MLLLQQRLTSPFGERISPTYKVPEFHTGVDLVDDNMNDVYAILPGFVRKSEFGKFEEGNYVQIKSIIKDVLFYHNYFHNKSNLVNANVTVRKDQLIAFQGNTGNAKGVHSHLEIFLMESQLQTSFAKKLIKNVEYKKIGKRIFLNPFDFEKFII